MFIKRFKVSLLAFAGIAAISTNFAVAADQPAASLDELLQFVKKGQVAESKENRAREASFAKDKANQAAAVKRAEQERTRQEQRSERLENEFEENELLISAKQAQLREKLGTLAELFGHLTSASGDLASNIEVSLWPLPSTPIAKSSSRN